MRKRELLQLVRRGEASTQQFKANVTNPDSLAAGIGVEPGYPTGIFTGLHFNR